MFRLTLSSDTGTFVLSIEPRGFEDTELILTRNRKRHGFNTEYSIDIDFVCNGGGREFIESDFDDFGINREINFLVEFQCDADADFEELNLFKLNLESLQIEEPFLSVNLEQIGLSQAIENRKDVPINLLSTVTLKGSVMTPFAFGPYDLTLHSKTLRFQSIISGGSFIDSHAFTGINVSIIYQLIMQPPLNLQKNELTETLSNLKTTNKIAGGGGSIESLGLDFFHNSLNQSPVLLPGSYEVVYNFSGDFIDTNSGNTWEISDITLDIAFGPDVDNLSFVNLVTIPGYSSSQPSETRGFNELATVFINMIPGDILFLAWNVTQYVIQTGGSPETIDLDFDYTNSEIRISIDSTIASSFSKAFMIHEAFATVIRSITDNVGILDSDVMGRTNSLPTIHAQNGYAGWYAVTVGLQIRKLLTAPIPMSFEDLFNCMTNLFNLGYEVNEDTVTIEPAEFFYNTTVIHTISNTDDLIIQVAKDYHYHKVISGFKKWETEAVNGLDSFHTEHVYSTALTVVNNELDIRNEYIAEGYIIEVQRRAQFEETTDFKNDDDNFILSVKRTVSGGNIPTELDKTEQDENFTTLNNILFPATVYNPNLDPKRSVFRWMNIIGVGLLKNPGSDLTFLSGQGNIEFESARIDDNEPGDFSGVAITMDDNIQVDDANLENGTPLFIPEIYKLTDILTFEDYKTIRDNPHGIILVDGVKCYLLELRFRIGDNTADFELIRANL